MPGSQKSEKLYGSARKNEIGRMVLFFLLLRTAASVVSYVFYRSSGRAVAQLVFRVTECEWCAPKKKSGAHAHAYACGGHIISSYIYILPRLTEPCNASRRDLPLLGEYIGAATRPAVGLDGCAPDIVGAREIDGDELIRTNLVPLLLTRAVVIAAPIPALPPVTIANLPSSMSLLHGKGGSSGAGLPVGILFFCACGWATM